jgi:hypothetical protein
VADDDEFRRLQNDGPRQLRVHRPSLPASVS